jgi:hypothetical protein
MDADCVMVYEEPRPGNGTGDVAGYATLNVRY